MSNGQHTNGNGYKVPTGRAEWIVKRKAEAERTGDWNMSQMHFARKGLITEEMAFVAQREKISAELVRSEVAKGTMIIPANINHVEAGADGDWGGVAVQDQCEYRELGDRVECG